jgi:hypothetical protein
MRHPFDLVANFVAYQKVVIASAADAILGVTPLSDDEVGYLDAAGNRNGVYDLGDFLAEAERAGVLAQDQISRVAGR